MRCESDESGPAAASCLRRPPVCVFLRDRDLGALVATSFGDIKADLVWGVNRIPGVNVKGQLLISDDDKTS